MKKILVKSCFMCPVWQSVDNEGDTVYCSQALLTETEHTYDLVSYIPPDCPLPDEPEKMKGIICIEDFKSYLSCEGKYDWWIDLDDVTIEGQEIFSTEEEARADALEWAKKLGVEVEG